jgi:RNA polymerase sigma-70 factor (ECF subfamily)
MGARPPLDGATPDSSMLSERVRAMVDAHFDFIWRLLRRQSLPAADADDAAQQVFMVAAQKLNDIAPDSERSFLYGVARRVAANARRTSQRRREVSADALDSRPTDDASADQQIDLGRAWVLLDELFAELPADLARVLALAEIEEVSVPEIAVLEGIPVGTAASRLRRARAAFRELTERVQHRNPFRKETP